MEANKSKRLKKVFSSSEEVLHLWANQTQSSARKAGDKGHVFFQDKTCYSYGYHYQLGELATINGNTIALINRTGRSNTTRKHISQASSAASHIPQIDVDHTFDWQAGIATMANDLIDQLTKVFTQRSFWAGINYVPSKEIEEFNTLCRLVGMPKLQIHVTAEFAADIKAHIDACIKREAELKALRTTPEYQAKREAAQVRAEILKAAKAQAEIEAWKIGGPFTPAVSSMHPQLIRIKDGQVETSRRAHVQLETAKRALALIVRGQLETGTRLDGFEYRGLNGDTAIIGCHTLSLSQARQVLQANLKLVG